MTGDSALQRQGASVPTALGDPAVLASVLRMRGKNNSLHDIQRAAEFLEALSEQRDTAQSAVEAWAGVCESLEAHLQDRVAMRDEANPERYLSILRSNIANVHRNSQQIRASRWHDRARLSEQIARLEAQRDALNDAATRLLEANDAVVNEMLGALDQADRQAIAQRGSDLFTATLGPLRAAVLKTTTVGETGSLGTPEGVTSNTSEQST